MKSKNKTEKQVILKIKNLPEIKEWLSKAKHLNTDILINKPDLTNKYYSFQVGINDLNMFRTNYWLSVDPKSLKVYYVDFMDSSGYKSIPLQQWRHWRNNPGFQKAHFIKDGKLAVLKDDKYKNSKNRKKI